MRFWCLRLSSSSECPTVNPLGPVAFLKWLLCARCCWTRGARYGPDDADNWSFRSCSSRGCWIQFALCSFWWWSGPRCSAGMDKKARYMARCRFRRRQLHVQGWYCCLKTPRDVFPSVLCRPDALHYGRYESEGVCCETALVTSRCRASLANNASRSEINRDQQCE